VSVTTDRETVLGAISQIDAGPLNVGYLDRGPADAPAVLLLHGWPYDIHSFADVVPLLTAAGHRVVVPYLRGFGTTRFRSEDAARNGEQAALALDAVNLMDALGIDCAVFGGFDWGARSANIVAALWPERCRGLVSVSGYLIGSQASGSQPLPPEAELQWWYQYYFATERGRAGYERYRREFAKLIWRTASPRWDFDEATFDRSAKSFDNPDHVAIVVDNYRWRLGLSNGEAENAGLEERLATGPAIGVPTITLEGDANGAPHPEPSAYAAKFRAATRTERLKVGSGTTFRRRPRRRSPTRSSSSAPPVRRRADRTTADDNGRAHQRPGGVRRDAPSQLPVRKTMADAVRRDRIDSLRHRLHRCRDPQQPSA
jgi:pimeloyl-ACP methyl ester carboxylesterase